MVTINKNDDQVKRKNFPKGRIKINMNILVIDGQGGRIGQLLITGIKERIPDATVIAVGTNSIATSNMLKASPAQIATGENPVCVACRKADVIVGPVGIVIADAMLGEITPNMAKAVGQSEARKVLIPLNRCDNVVVGIKELSMNEMIEAALQAIICEDCK